MDAFIFTQLYHSPDSPLMRRIGNEILCNEVGKAPAGTRPTHTCDIGGFHACAQNLRNHWGIRNPAFKYDNYQPEAVREQAICEALAAAPQDLAFVAYLGHGVPTGLESAGIHLRNWHRFRDLLMARCAVNSSIVLYACSTGARNGFAQALAEYLAPKNIWVWGHAIPCKYSNLSQFVRYPGGVPYGGLGNVFNFWHLERDASPEDRAALGNQAAQALAAAGLL